MATKNSLQKEVKYFEAIISNTVLLLPDEPFGQKMVDALAIPSIKSALIRALQPFSRNPKKLTKRIESKSTSQTIAGNVNYDNSNKFFSEKTDSDKNTYDRFSGENVEDLINASLVETKQKPRISSKLTKLLEQGLVNSYTQLSINEACLMFSMSRSEINRLIQAGLPHRVSPGGGKKRRVKIAVGDMNKFLNKCQKIERIGLQGDDEPLI